MRRRDRARTNARDAVRRPNRANDANPRQLARGTAAGSRDHEPAEAVFVATPSELGAVGRPRVRTLTVAPRGLGVLPTLRDHGARIRAPITVIGKVGDPQHGPAVGVGDERELRTVGREPRLARGHRVATGRTCAPDARPSNERTMTSRRVPRHVGQVPFVPREHRSVGRPRRIPGVVGVSDAHRPRRSVEWHGRDVARVVSLDRERDLAPCGDCRPDRVALAVQHPTGRAVRCDRDESAVAGDDHQLVVTRPAPAGTERAVGGHHRGRNRTVGRGDHEVAAAVEAVGPRQPIPRRRPAGIGDTVRAGDQRGGDRRRHGGER